MYTHRKPFPSPKAAVEPKKRTKKVAELVVETPIEEVVEVIEAPVTDTIIAEEE
jgi:hypothetical protein